MTAQVRQIVTATTYVLGNSMLGKTEEVKVPDFVFLHSEYAAQGLFGKIELPTGVDKLDVDIKWKSVFEDMFGDLANPFKATEVQMRSEVENWGDGGMESSGELVSIMRLRPKKVPTGGLFKQGTRTDFSGQYSCTYFKQELDAVPLIEYDFWRNIFRIGGVDVLKNFRSKQGQGN